jgi:hypothetical protein
MFNFAQNSFYMKNLIFILTLLVFFAGCKSETGTVIQQPKVQYAHGKINQILVIADEDLWRSPVGDTFFYYFNAPYLILPQPEPMFDLQHLTPEELVKQPVKKEFRTILFLADLKDESSLAAQFVRKDLGLAKIDEIQRGKGSNTTVGQDKWAKNQLLFYVSGFGEEKLIDNIAKNFPPIARRINETDSEVIKATAFQAGENGNLVAEVKTTLDVDIKVPGDFKKAKFDGKSNTLWLRRDDREIIANILIHKRPYTSKKQLTKEGIKAIRDEVGRIVTSTQPNSYMRINDVDLPMFSETKTINSRYAVQARGIWEMENDFKGGPFISNLLLEPDKGELLFVDGFILAPGKDKRNYMQEMEMIISSASF